MGKEVALVISICTLALNLMVLALVFALADINDSLRSIEAAVESNTDVVYVTAEECDGLI